MLISAAPLKRSCCCPKGAVTLRTRSPGCRVDIKENAVRWQELSFNQPSLCFAYLPWFKTKLTLMNSRWGSSELHVISVRYSSGKTDLCPHLPLKGLFCLHEELWHSAPGLPDAGLILKKLLPVGKSFLLINTPFVLLIYLDLKQNSPWWIQGDGIAKQKQPLLRLFLSAKSLQHLNEQRKRERPRRI